MTARVTHRTYCRICIAACGLEIDVEDGQAIAVRGDVAHPLSAGYTCSKGRSLPAMHHGPGRLDVTMLRTDGALRPATWDTTLDDLRHRLDDVVREHGTGSVGFFLGGGIYMDTAAYWCFRRISRRFDTGHIYSDTTIDSAAKYRAMELVAGTYSLMPHVDRDARLVLMLGTNPVVSHGQTPMFGDPVQRMRRTTQHGEVWVVDPRVTGSARLAADALLELLAALRRAGRLAVLTGTGVTMSRGGNITEWLVWALLTLTDSFDRPGGMWFNPGFLARLDERDALPGVGPARAGPASRPEINPLMGEWPAAVVPAEIESGNLRALIVLGGNLVTALPDTARVLAALPRLDVLAVVDVIETPTNAVATHVLPTHAQLERPDIPLLNDLYNSERMMQYSPG